MQEPFTFRVGYRVPHSVTSDDAVGGDIQVPGDADVVKRELLPLVVHFDDCCDDADAVWSTPSSRTPESECAICLDSDSDCHLRTCHHGFHRDCLTKWFCKSHK